MYFLKNQNNNPISNQFKFFSNQTIHSKFRLPPCLWNQMQQALPRQLTQGIEEQA